MPYATTAQQIGRAPTANNTPRDQLAPGYDPRLSVRSSAPTLAHQRVMLCARTGADEERTASVQAGVRYVDSGQGESEVQRFGDSQMPGSEPRYAPGCDSQRSHGERQRSPGESSGRRGSSAGSTSARLQFPLSSDGDASALW
eukprot:67667-Rhodomonas_salina.3